MGDENQKKLSYLLEGSFNCLPKSFIKLRSYFNIYASQVAEKCQFSLPKFFNSKTISCPFCFTSWNFNTCSFKLLPSTGKKFKIENQQRKDEERCEQSCTRNQLVLKCKLCLRNTKFSFIKPKKEKVKDSQNELIAPMTKQKKKKKKKCANLSVKACLEAGFKLNKKKEKRNKSRDSTSVVNNSGVPDQLTSPHQKTPVSLFKNPYAQTSQYLRTQTKKSKEKFRSRQVKSSCSNSYSNTQMSRKRKQLKALEKAMKEEKKSPEKSSLRDFLNVIG